MTSGPDLRAAREVAELTAREAAELTVGSGDPAPPAREAAEPGADDHATTVHADGEIRVRRGRVPAWLRVVYVALAVWGVWYLVAHWGGLGPGLGR